MTPLDDQLRSALQGRAAQLAPTTDPLAGIEARAGRIRRRRTLAAMTGAALAVAAVAVAVPMLSNGTTAPDQFTSPSSDTVRASYALDPTHPWAFRGTPLSQGTADRFAAEWQVRSQGSTPMTLLFAQTYEPSASEEAVFVVADGTYGFVRSTESGADFLYVLPLLAGESVLAFALPGDEQARLLVVAAPSVTSFEYAPDGLTYAPMTRLTDGVAIASLDGERSLDRLRVSASDGTVLYEGEAVDPLVVESPAPVEQPANVLSWPARGDASVGPSVADLKAAFAQQNGQPARAVRYRALFTGDTDSGVRFTVGQVWFEGDSRVNTVSYVTGGTNGPVLRDYGYTPEVPTAVVALLKDLPGTSVDLLVVVPVPTTGQVSYAPAATGAFRPVTGQDHLDGVVLIDRAKGATGDRLEILDGNGDLDKPLYRGPVVTLLCESDCPYAVH